jgi:hypothetical protein
LYTKEPRPTDEKTHPVEPENIPKEPKVRPQADQAEQLSLLSAEELAKLHCPSGSRSPREGEMQSSDTTTARKAPRTKGGATQLKLPGF